MRHVTTTISGHDLYGCRIYYHGTTVDTTVVVELSSDEEHTWTPGLFGISEPVFVAAEDLAYMVATGYGDRVRRKGLRKD